ncbi:MAG: NYN domain-containing protein [Candidatus Portnoybacteria bacterium]|nr:NYN domain-containing protein [Candidatus Portnoybacteria bacterium]MDD4982742.1 NYN domain-containing protein [Candidatus Portnoybacteria bacterium]
MSVIKHRDQRVGVFIDVANLYHSAKNLYRAKVNFKEVLKTAIAGRHLIRAMAYSVRTEGGEEQAFVEALTKSGIEVRLKDLQIFPGGMKKGDWDVGLAIDAIKLGAKLDAIVLVTGDGDFAPLVEFLKVNFGSQVEVIGFGRSTSGLLKEVADDFTDLGDNIKKYLINQ